MSPARLWISPFFPVLCIIWTREWLHIDGQRAMYWFRTVSLSLLTSGLALSQLWSLWRCICCLPRYVILHKENFKLWKTFCQTSLFNHNQFQIRWKYISYNSLSALITIYITVNNMLSCEKLISLLERKGTSETVIIQALTLVHEVPCWWKMILNNPPTWFTAHTCYIHTHASTLCLTKLCCSVKGNIWNLMKRFHTATLILTGDNIVTNSRPPACDQPLHSNGGRVAHRTDNSVAALLV